MAAVLSPITTPSIGLLAKSPEHSIILCPPSTYRAVILNIDCSSCKLLLTLFVCRGRRSKHGYTATHARAAICRGADTMPPSGLQWSRGKKRGTKTALPLGRWNTLDRERLSTRQEPVIAISASITGQLGAAHVDDQKPLLNKYS